MADRSVERAEPVIGSANDRDGGTDFEDEDENDMRCLSLPITDY